jgi:formylmethanofuran dehydrogenase subunit A
MLIRLKGGRVVDPAHDRDTIEDVWMQDGRIVVRPPRGTEPDAVYDATGKIVMAGGIDIHSHVAGGNVTLSRLLLPELHEGTEAPPDGQPFGTARWSSYETGRLYARMGFTTVVEPAVAPAQALQAHLELADLPILDKATLTVLGNDDVLLGLLRDKAGRNAVADYVGLVVARTRALGVKCINAGGSAAFKENVRTFALDDVVPAYGVSSRQIVEALQQAVVDLGIRHPLHVHCNNLGVPGAIDALVETIEAADGKPLHLAHVQFYAYGDEGKRRFVSAAGRLISALNLNPNVTVDVGQVMFGQTVTISSDVIRQFASRDFASPNKWIVWDGDGNGGGIVPFHYKASNTINALQWAIGLEIFLSAHDPWQVYFTTDHPNGAPFTTYPKLLHLLMDANERARFIAGLPKAAMALTALPSIGREFTLDEVAIMTRAAPARLLGLKDRGHLSPGAVADVAVYDDKADRTAMFEAAAFVFKDGHLVVRDGEVTEYRFGRAQTVEPPFDKRIVKRVDDRLGALHGSDSRLYAVPAGSLGRDEPFKVHPCRS